MAESFEIDDLVWAKMKGFPAWPGKISQPPDQKKSSDKKPRHYIFFFGTENYAWVYDDMIWSYVENKDKYSTPPRPSHSFQEAVDAIEGYIKEFGHQPPRLTPQTLETNSETSLETTSESKPSIENKDKVVKKDPAISTEDRKKELGKSRPALKHPSTSTPHSAPPSKFRLLYSDETSSFAAAISGSSFQFDDSLSASKSLQKKSSLRETSKADPKPKSTQPFLPDVLPSATETSSRIPSRLKFGFLGIGIMGSGMVENLLRTGHDVTIWNRTADNCRDFIKDGATKGKNAADVVQSCDITFACVTDSLAVKDLVFGNCGVLQGISEGKAFVDLSTVDVETSTDVFEAIAARGGRFLEAPVIGDKELSKAGQLIILAAGDKSLYNDCTSCFRAFGKNHFYLGEVGAASKMKLVLNALFGATLAGLAESLALASKVGLDQSEVLEILGHSSAGSVFLHDKGSDMINSRIQDPSCKLQTMQKDLRLAINMSDGVDQPMHVGSAVNELFKKAKAKGYGDSDIAAVYRAADL